MKSVQHKLGRWKEFLPAIVLFSIGFAFIAVKEIDSDTSFLIATGEYITKHGIPKVNPFCIHENFNVVIQQSLLDVVAYYLYHFFSWNGIRAWGMMVYGVTMISVYRTLMVFAGETGRKKCALIVTGCLGLILLPYLSIRPQGLTLNLFLWELRILEKYQKNHSIKTLLWLPLVSFIQINLHMSYWMFLFVLTCPYFASHIIKEKTWIRKGVLGILWIPMIAVAFVNPYGWEGMMYFLNAHGSASSNGYIAELNPPTFDSFIGCYLLCLVVVALLAVIKAKQFIFLEYDLLALGTYLLAVQYVKNLWLFVLGLIPILAVGYVSENGYVFRTPSMSEKVKDVVTYGIVMMFVFSMAIGIIVCTETMEPQESSSFPHQAVEYLDVNAEKDVRIYNCFDTGGYLELHGYKVYMDPRPELFDKKINKNSDVYQEYLKAEMTGDMNYKELIEEYKFEVILINRDSLFQVYLNTQNVFKKVVETEEYTLWHKK